MFQKKSLLKERVIKNSFWAFISSSTNRFGVLIFTIILARFLLPEGYGIYSITLSTAMIFHMFTDLGINNTLVRYISLSLVKNRKNIFAYHKYLLKIKFIFSILASILLFTLAYPLAFYFFKKPGLFPLFLISSIYILVFSFENFYSQIFYAIEKVKYLGIKEFLGQFLKIILSLGIFYFVNSTYHLSGIFLVLIFTSSFLILYCFFYSKKFLPEMYKRSPQEIDKKRVRKFMGFLTIASISTAFFLNVDSLILGFFLLPEYAGYYRAAFSLILGAAGFISFPITILLPILTKLNKLKKEILMNNSIKYSSMIVFPSMFGLFLLGKYFINIFYGPEYIPSIILLNILSFLLFPMIFVNLFLSLFSAEEKPNIFAKLIFFATLFNVILNVILIKFFLLTKDSQLWATAGVAIATVVSWYVCFFGAIYFSNKTFSFKFPFKQIIKPLISSFFMMIFLKLFFYFIKDPNLFFGILGIFFGMVFYFIILFIIKGIKKEDFQLLSFLKPKFF